MHLPRVLQQRLDVLRRHRELDVRQRARRKVWARRPRARARARPQPDRLRRGRAHRARRDLAPARWRTAGARARAGRGLPGLGGVRRGGLGAVVRALARVRVDLADVRELDRARVRLQDRGRDRGRFLRRLAHRAPQRRLRAVGRAVDAAVWVHGQGALEEVGGLALLAAHGDRAVGRYPERARGVVEVGRALHAVPLVLVTKARATATCLAGAAAWEPGLIVGQVVDGLARCGRFGLLAEAKDRRERRTPRGRLVRQRRRGAVRRVGVVHVATARARRDGFRTCAALRTAPLDN